MSTPEVQSPDAVNDLRNPSELPPEAGEAYVDPRGNQVINNLLIVSIAARRQHTQQTLIHRQDVYRLNDEPLQYQAIEILRGAAVAGLDRLRGDYVVQSVDHSMYDQLFDRFSDKSHVDFVNHLAEYNWHKHYLLEQPATYELDHSERLRFKETERCMTNMGFQLFRDMFLGYATALEHRDKHPDLLERTIDPEVLRAFLDENYLREQRRLIPVHIMDKVRQSREYDFYDWMLAEAQKLRAQRVGAHALTSSVK